jgi:hypothetical protein
MNTNKQDEQRQCVDLSPLPQQNQGLVTTENGALIIRYAPVTSLVHPRIPGLHRGAMRISEDFNDPLPDDFWFGASA